ncbi:MAG TPA: adenine deaminase [Firmicutes bacterium]|nr:adenine deaminase [Bacillota bacterium]
MTPCRKERPVGRGLRANDIGLVSIVRCQNLSEITRHLVAAAMGRDKADLVIKGGDLVNVNTAEIISGVDVAIKHGRVVLVGDAAHTIGEGTRILDATGYYLVPGLLDGHVHVESSMVTVTEFARAVLPCGTTGIFMDPHEIANVLGVEGVKLMVNEGRGLPLKVYATMPSCVPAAPGFEDAGAAIGPEDIREAMRWEGIIGLGEMMNFPGVLAGDEFVHAEIAETLRAGKVVTGHYSIPETGTGLQAYIAAGIASCHESTRKEDALARLRLGMYAKMREGSAWHDVKATIKSVTETKVDTRHAILVTDDMHPDTLVTLGHLNHVVRRAIEEGMDPIRAIQMATINVADCFGVSRDLGSISPGRCADILLVRDLAGMRVEKVIVDGELVAENGELLVPLPDVTYPELATHSVHLARPLRAEDFIIRIPAGEANLARKKGNSHFTTVRAIEVIEAKVGTRHVLVQLPVESNPGTGERGVSASAEHDIAKVAVIERHRGDKGIGLGFVKGFGFKEGAVASTVAHDSHNLLVVGMADDDMAFAANTLAKCGGGMVAVSHGEVLALVPLPIAGLMSDRPVREVARQVEELEAAWRRLGCRLVSPFMTMALLSLPVLPELRITNRGLVDTVAFKFVDVFNPEVEVVRA